MSNNTEEENDRLTADEDYELIRRCQKGESAAFEALVEKYQKKMLNTAYRMIGNYEEACEVVQDAFLAAYRSIKQFRGESRFSTWLYSIVINLSKNRLKKVKSRLHREGLSIDDPGRNIHCQDKNNPPTHETSMVDHLERREVQARVQECMNTLDHEYREVLVLRDVQGFSYEEIRAILKIPDGTVKSRLFRARDALKECLKKALGDL
jgi:RNA polymerase sigma-70 factor (ECF subfamily)